MYSPKSTGSTVLQQTVVFPRGAWPCCEALQQPAFLVQKNASYTLYVSRGTTYYTERPTSTSIYIYAHLFLLAVFGPMYYLPSLIMLEKACSLL